MTKIAPEDKLEKQDIDLFEMLSAIDNKDYGWYDRLTEEQKKKVVPYLLMQWTSMVSGKKEAQQFYVLSTNYHANRHMFNEVIQNHTEMQWMMLCASSPGIGKQRHTWIPQLSPKYGQLKAKATVKEVAEYFKKLYDGADKNLITQFAQDWVIEQNHRYRIAQLHPEMKLSDIELLSKLVTTEELDDYEKEAGINQN